MNRLCRGSLVVQYEHRDQIVGPGAVVTDSVLHGNVSVTDGARVSNSVVGPGSEIRRARVEGSVLGEGVSVLPGAELVGARVEPGTTVS